MANDIPTHPTSLKRSSSSILAILALLLGAIAIVVAISGKQPGSPPASAVLDTNTLARILKTKTLRVGYEGYAPYTIKDPTTGKLSGVSVDLAEYIAREAGWRVEWIQTSPDTKIPDLQAGKFDVMTEPILGTIPRATRVSFSRSYASFADASAIVRKGDSRFKSILDLDKAGVTIAVRAGYTDQTFAADNLPSATLRALKVDDASQVFMEVIAGKADASLADSEQVKAFAAKHPTEVEARFIDPAPSYIPAGLMYRQGDFVFGNFLDTALNYMDANAVFAHLGRKYNLPPGTLRLR